MIRPSPGQLAHLACLFEATARKPGNIHRFADFDDATYLDFLISAAAIVAPLDRAPALGVGAAVLEAVEATRSWTTTNTNLGMILLLAPLAALPEDTRVGRGLRSLLSSTTVDDARLVYQAIRLARPGGLGRSTEQDVADEPTVTLLEAMSLAAHRDAVARQYATNYADVRAWLRPLRRDLRAGRPLEVAIIRLHLHILGAGPDSLIARKCGETVAREASNRARRALEAGWPDRGRSELDLLDTWLRAEGHTRNPGTSADLVTAVLFLALRSGTITLPRPAGPSGWSGPG
jgi:triphosphoribosyl-dephospho-CoA synthase